MLAGSSAPWTTARAWSAWSTLFSRNSRRAPPTAEARPRNPPAPVRIPRALNPMILPIFLALLQGASPQAAPPKAAQGAVAVRTQEPEFNALLLRYGAAIREYDDRRVRMARARSTSPQPPSPARTFFSEFLALAGKDSGGAQGWVIENLRDGIEDPTQRVRIAKEIFPKLLAKHADEDSATHAMTGIKQISADLGEALSMEMARALEEKSQVPDVKAEAMMLQAWIHSEGGKTTDPTRLKDTDEIYRSILFTLPTTRAGQAVAGIIIGPVEESFFATG